MIMKLSSFLLLTLTFSPAYGQEHLLELGRFEHFKPGLERTAVEFRCHNCPSQTAPFITSWAQKLKDVTDFFGVVDDQALPTNTWLRYVDHHIDDPFFGKDIANHCGGDKCPYTTVRSFVVPSFKDIEDQANSEDESFEDIEDQDDDFVTIPAPLNDADQIQPFEVVDDSYTVFGKSTGKNQAAVGACVEFQELSQKVFLKLHMNLLAFFAPSGNFVLYKKLQDVTERPVYGGPVVEDLLSMFAHKSFNQDSKRQYNENVLKHNKKFLARKDSLARGVWNKFLENTPTELTEELLDDAIAKIHRSLDSIKLIADSEQVASMAIGKAIRAQKKKIRRFENVAMFVGTACVIGVTVMAAPVVAAGAAAAVATAAAVVGIEAAGAALAVVGIEAAGAALASNAMKTIPKLVVKEAVKFRKRQLADEHGVHKNIVGKTTNQLRWVRGMLRWSEEFLEIDPIDVTKVAHPIFRVRPELMCAKFAEKEVVEKCNPFVSVKTSSEGSEAWDRDDLEKYRIFYKAQFLTTFIQFVTNDGGCSSVPFDKVEELTVKANEEVDDVFDRMFDSSWFEEAKKEEQKKTIWSKYCEELKVEHFFLNPYHLLKGNKKNKVDKTAQTNCHNFAFTSNEMHRGAQAFCKEVHPKSEKKFNVCLAFIIEQNRKIEVAEAAVRMAKRRNTPEYKEMMRKQLIKDNERAASNSDMDDFMNGQMY